MSDDITVDGSDTEVITDDEIAVASVKEKRTQRKFEAWSWHDTGTGIIEPREEEQDLRRLVCCRCCCC